MSFPLEYWHISRKSKKSPGKERTALTFTLRGLVRHCLCPKSFPNLSQWLCQVSKFQVRSRSSLAFLTLSPAQPNSSLINNLQTSQAYLCRQLAVIHISCLSPKSRLCYSCLAQDKSRGKVLEQGYIIVLNLKKQKSRDVY